MAGPDGRIFVADTDNSRARLYADAFDFMHLDLHEPFRPMLFERAALAAQEQKADVLVIDNFAAEWNGPGGILEWHEEELNRMAGDNFQRRESLKMVCWGKVKPPHKHMFQRLYQLNMPIILCCAAERKIAMIKQTEGKDKGKVIPVDQGFQPIGDKDAAYAMTASLLLPDVKMPGVPVAIKALLPDLQPIIHLDRPLDEATGAAIAAWARGEKPASAQTETSQGGLGSTPPPSHQPSEPDKRTSRRQVDEASIEEGAKNLAAMFLGAEDRKAYFAMVDDADIRRQLEWLKKNRRALYYREVEPNRDACWRRTEPPPPTEPPKQGDLMDDKADRAEGDPGSG